jgi:hypothetical protein
MDKPTTPNYDRIALDAAAVVQSLSRCAAEFQAKAVAHRGLVEAAGMKGLAELAAHASLVVECYEDAAARVFQTIQNIVTGQQQGGATATTERGVGTPAPPTSSLQQHCDAVSPNASKLCRRAESEKVSPPDRYAALVGLVRELTTTAEHPKLSKAQHDDLTKLYDAITDKLPDLEEVAVALRKIEADWKQQGVAEGSTSVDQTSSTTVRRSDWFKKMYMHINNLKTLRGRRDDVDMNPDLLQEYVTTVDVTIANMTTQQWPGGSVSAMVESTTKELRRLRADLGVVVAIGRLRGSNIGKET